MVEGCGVKPVVTTDDVIAAVTRVEQVDANVKAAEWRLTGDELAEVRKVLEG